MTYTFNGIGTAIYGERLLTKEEIDMWSANFPFLTGQSISNLIIGTESLTIFFVPILPYRTIVYYYTQKDYSRSEFQIVYFPPSGKEQIYWPHVKNSYAFYIFPIVLVLACIWLKIPR